MNIDVHGHIAVKELLRSGKDEESWRYQLETKPAGAKLTSGDGKDVVPCQHEPVELSRVVEHLDAVHVDVMAVSVMPFQMYYQLDEKTALSTSRIANDAIAAAVGEYPQRLVGMGTLPMQNVDCAIEELRRIVEEFNFRAVQLGSNVNGVYLGAEKFRPLWQAVQDLDVFVFVHPVQVIGADRLQQYFLGNLIGNPIETCRCIADVVFSGLIEEYPKLKICFAHGGGAAPYLWGRWEHGYWQRAEARTKIQRSPSEYIRALYFDTITHSPSALEYLVNEVGADHIVVGSDYPFDMGPQEPIGFVECIPQLSQKSKNKITGETAARLLGLESAKINS